MASESISGCRFHVTAAFAESRLELSLWTLEVGCQPDEGWAGVCINTSMTAGRKREALLNRSASEARSQREGPGAGCCCWFNTARHPSVDFIECGGLKQRRECYGLRRGSGQVAGMEKETMCHVPPFSVHSRRLEPSLRLGTAKSRSSPAARPNSDRSPLPVEF